MELEQLLYKKRVLDANITKSIDILIEEFRKETGLSPSAIDIQMIDASTIDDVTPRFVVGIATTHIQLC